MKCFVGSVEGYAELKRALSRKEDKRRLETLKI